MADNRSPLERLRDTAIKLVREAASIILHAKLCDNSGLDIGQFEVYYLAIHDRKQRPWPAWELMAEANAHAVTLDGLAGMSYVDITFQMAHGIAAILAEETTYLGEENGTKRYNTDSVRAANKIRHFQSFDAPLLCEHIKKECERAYVISASRPIDPAYPAPHLPYSPTPEPRLDEGIVFHEFGPIDKGRLGVKENEAGETLAANRPPRRVSGGPVVLLNGQGNNVVVSGNEKPPLTVPQYNVVQSLIDAGMGGLNKDELVQKSGHTDARGILSRLVQSDTDWKKAIGMPGKPGGRYRVRTNPH